MAIFISHSPAETESLGEQWGREARHGLVLALSGDLGAGKTQLVKGLARGLGIAQRVHSPTFALLNEYGGGRLRLFHIDLFRLDTPEQIRRSGLEEFWNPDGVAVIEWAEKADEEFSMTHVETGRTVRRVAIQVLSETERRITYEDSGA